MMTGVYDPPCEYCMYTEIKLDNSIQCETMFKIIGKEGRAFKSITFESRCQYIWWNSERHVIEIWGPNDYALRNAYNRLIERIDRMVSQQIIFGNFSDRILYNLPELAMVVYSLGNSKMEHRLIRYFYKVTYLRISCH